MKTLEEMAKLYANEECTGNAMYGDGLYEGYLAGYKAAQDQLADADKVMFCVYCNDMHGGDCAVGKGKNHPALAKSQWISVKDRLPEDNSGLLLVYNSRLKKIGTSYWNEGIWCGGTWPVTSQFITYWMPIPELPKEEK